MTRRIRVTVAVVAILALSGCATQDPGSQSTPTQSGAAELEVGATLSELRDAVHRQDLDEIVAFFADDYSSREATGKTAVREWWARVIETGLAEKLQFDLSTAQLDVGDDVAEVTYYDEHGELACTNVTEPCTTPQPYLDFRLERDDQGGWLITGIPSENRSPTRR